MFKSIKFIIIIDATNPIVGVPLFIILLYLLNPNRPDSVESTIKTHDPIWNQIKVH